MKKTFKVLGVITFVAIVGFSLVTCDDSGGGGGDGGGVVGPAFIGDELKIENQQVYTADENEYGIIYSAYNGSKTLTESYGGIGGITNGKFSFTLGTPNSISLSTVSSFLPEYSGYFDNLTISNTQAKGLSIETFNFSDYAGLTRIYESYNISVNSLSSTVYMINYVYVDNDVTISGKGKTQTWQETHEGITYEQTTTTQNLNITLKKGWNVVRQTINSSQSYAETSITGNATISISLGDLSSCKWVLDQ